LPDFIFILVSRWDPFSCCCRSTNCSWEIQRVHGSGVREITCRRNKFVGNKFVGNKFVGNKVGALGPTTVWLLLQLLQCFAVCCSALQCCGGGGWGLGLGLGGVWGEEGWVLNPAFLPSCSALQCVAVLNPPFLPSCSALQCVAVRRSVLQCVAVCRSVLQCVAVYCSVLQCCADSTTTLGPTTV